LSGVQGERPFLVVDGTELSAVGAGDLGGQPTSAPFQQRGERALGQTGGRGDRQVFHGLEIEGGVRSGLAQGTSRHNFAPLGGESLDFSDLLGVELAACHVESFLVLRGNGPEALLGSFYHQALCSAK
jgi:hypothetical protein